MIMFTFHVTSNAICALEDSADAAADGPCQCSVWYTREQHLTVKPLSCLELTYDYELLKRSLSPCCFDYHLGRIRGRTSSIDFFCGGLPAYLFNCHGALPGPENRPTQTQHFP